MSCRAGWGEIVELKARNSLRVGVGLRGSARTPKSAFG